MRGILPAMAPKVPEGERTSYEDFLRGGEDDHDEAEKEAADDAAARRELERAERKRKRDERPHLPRPIPRLDD
jgi:hypothetical protein